MCPYGEEQTQRPVLWSALADEHEVPGASGAALTARCPTESSVQLTQAPLETAVHVIGTEAPPTRVRPVP